jgi:hypothetical protein
MKTRTVLLILANLFAAAFASAQDPPQPTIVEAVEVSGVPLDRLSQALRDDLQKLEGQGYDPAAASALADRIQSELPDHVAAARTVPGNQAGRVRVVIVVAGVSQTDVVGVNVNAKYPVESVTVEGIPRPQISDSLWDELQKMVGQPLNDPEAGRLQMALQSELGTRYEVSRRVEKGKPRQVAVIFQVVKSRFLRWAAPQTILAYQPKQGLTAFLHMREIYSRSFYNTSGPGGALHLGFGSNGDDLIERYKGYYIEVERLHIGTERLGFRFGFSDYGTTWKSQTELAAEQAQGPGTYRSRLGLEPAIAFGITPDLYVTAGFKFTRLKMQFPGTETEWANAGVAGIRYQRTMKSGNVLQQATADYSLHSAGDATGSDFIYTRHYFDGLYMLRKKLERKKPLKMISICKECFLNELSSPYFRLEARAGTVSGDPPMFERFSIGNTETARGWNKFDIAPLGATRMFATTVEGGVSGFRLFYDAGAVWDSGQKIVVRNSIGITISDDNDDPGEGLTFAFAIRDSRLVPAFMFRIMWR